MPEGKCAKCGTVYKGWALRYKPQGRILICPECGGEIETITGGIENERR